MRAAGWGNSLDRQTIPESPLGGQLQHWVTFQYYEFPRNQLPSHFVGDTIRTDFFNGAFLVSACRRNCFVKILEKCFPGILWYGRRSLIEIHIRKG